MINLEVFLVVYKSDPLTIEDNLKFLSSGIDSSKISLTINIFDNGICPEIEYLCKINAYNYFTLGKNIGFGCGHNYLYQRRLGLEKIFLILNPDIRLSGHSINLLVIFYKAIDHKIGILSPKLIYSDGRIQKICRFFPSPISLILRKISSKYLSFDDIPIDSCCNPLSVPFIHGACFLLGDWVIQDVGFFDPKFFLYCEDMDLCRRVLKRYEVVYYPNVQAIHELARGSSKSLRLFYYHIVSAIKYFNKWGWFFDRDRRMLNKTLLKYD